MESKKRIVLAFDIEKAGPRATDPILAIGASVINQDFKEVDSLFLPAHVPDQTKFDQKCWDEFWSKHPATLNSLTYDGILTPAERATEIAEKFQEFRREWETYARENDVEYYFVSDTNIFDAEAINQLLNSYCPDEAPIPYAASDKQYEDFINVSDFQRGVLAVIDPEFSGWWGMTDRIEELFNVPPKLRDHDHNPTNDAYTIAYDFLVLLGIKERTISLKKMPKQTKKKVIRQSNTTSSSIRTMGIYGVTAIAAIAMVSFIFRKS